MTNKSETAQRSEYYNRAWAIEKRAAELFKRDYPTGNMPRRRLPQFRSSYPDPVGDHYRRLASAELRNE
jgi:hypothetical protein